MHNAKNYEIRLKCLCSIGSVWNNGEAHKRIEAQLTLSGNGINERHVEFSEWQTDMIPTENCP